MKLDFSGVACMVCIGKNINGPAHKFLTLIAYTSKPVVSIRARGPVFSLSLPYFHNFSARSEDPGKTAHLRLCCLLMR